MSATHVDNDAGAHRIDVAEAERLILEHVPQAGHETVALAAATGRVLALQAIAERDQPPFDRATMDGIAVNARSLTNAAPTFRHAGTQAAGQPAGTLPDIGSCLEIMTGAPLPAGADTVIPVERVQHAASAELHRLEEGYRPEPGQFVHRRGSDHRRGDVLLAPGVRIRGPEMAILTATGAATVTVARPPTVAVVSTGDELVDVGQPVADHQIRSSNDRAIASALQLHGCTSVQRCCIADDRQQLLAQLGELHAQHDWLILSGGVSMGKYDYVPAVLATLGVRLVFHKVLQRPGLPMWFGVSRDGKPVFALPGNPVSTLVCLRRYVIPALQHSLGLATPDEVQYVRLQSDVSFKPDLCWLLPVVLHPAADGGIDAEPRPTNTSGDFTGLRGTHGFVELLRGRELFTAGTLVRYFGW